MYRIIDGRGTGKTGRLFLLAKETNSTIVCSNPYTFKEKAHAYGIAGINFMSYGEYIKNLTSESDNVENVIMDELESFMYLLSGKNMVGYSLTAED